MAREKPDKLDRFQLMIPVSMLDRVREMADDERRSASNMIVVLLDEALRARENQQPERREAALMAA